MKKMANNTRWKNQWIFTRKQVKKNEQTLANLSPAEEATSKDEVEIEKFLQEQK